jgi:tetratricopeptide (TPR) repeat protein
LRLVALCVLFVAGGNAQDLREAARLDREGKCSEAEPHYQKALAGGTASAALLNNAGNHYLRCNQPQKAQELFERVIQIAPSHANARLQLARLAVEVREGEKALAHLAYVRGSDMPVRLLRAESLYWAGKKEAATSELDALAKQSDPGTQIALGAAFARLALYDRAEAIFHAVLQKAPTDFDALFHYGRAAGRAQHYDRARTALESAVRIRPADVDALLELGLVAAASKDYTRAVYLLAQAQQRAPERADITLALARAAEDAGFYGDSALAYDRYIVLRPTDPLVRRDRARVLANTGSRLEEGLKEMAAYIAVHPEDPVGHYNVAQFTWKSTPEKSLAQLATALRLDPKFAPAHVSRAWLLHHLGRSAEAVPHLESALRVEPHNLRALDQLGLVYLALDRARDAEKALRQATAIDAQDVDVQLHLGRALMALGREQEAQPLLENYQQARRRRQRDPRREPGMIESATLTETQRRTREIDRLQKLAGARPDDPVLQLHFAGLLLADGRIEQAAEEYRKLLTLNIDAEICHQAGKSLVGAGQHALAREFLERAIPERPAARLDLAVARLHMSGPEEALKDLGEAPPEHAGDFLLMKARLLDVAGRRDEAGRLLTQGLRVPAVQPEIAAEAATILLRYQRERDALDLVARALAAAPDHAELLLAHAIVLALMERRDDAEKRLIDIEARWPEWRRPYLIHGLLLLGGTRTNEAKQKIRIAVALGSAEPEGRCARGLREFVFGSCEPVALY